MYKKDKSIRKCVGLRKGLALFFCIPLTIKANPSTAPAYKLREITIASTGAIAPTVRYPYLRLLKWLTPTTDASLIHRYLSLKPGATFDAQTLSCIKKRFTTLPYFSSVSITRKGVNGAADLIIETKDQFPIAVDLSLDKGPLCTITHHNAWGYGHCFSHQLFLKKRWGYGLTYELPKLHGNCFFGGQWYSQIGNTDGDNKYRFNYKNLWIGKLFAIQAKDPCAPYYWITGLSGATKQFTEPVSAAPNRKNYTLILGKIGWVADGYEEISGVYALHGLEKLPKGGAIEMLYGYQYYNDCKHYNRHYIGINGIKNIANPRLKYLHLSCESGAFIYKERFEEIILKLALAYAGPPIQTCNGARPFIRIDYIAGYRMDKERMLGIKRRDPEALEALESDNCMQEPIHARLNVHLDSTLHTPIMVKDIRFVCLGFMDFIALYNRNHQLLNQTWVDSYGAGLQLAHTTMPWLAGTLKLGYSPLLGKMVPSVQLAMGPFKNKTAPNPTLIAYS
ncbi:MAG: hypothetical protein NMK33_00620 [Candidatus Cardinium sp.]|uniref:hypothetical protein n=1 Tax=Cardinium endosymbiont of Dermatophagoides farinae TaxID=2597823 RepID=UPI0011835E79|nr:hypothetical protein [Cardinium endosymbiont of Dermatophagoides farinae]TSJ81029.1 hypothetical protein FPG78_03300 [Cardinium endosymbiont of Dermatophagoides farinae]UWW97056.1 MAG: hypothetical protein NMK33_00620 [Candidatus Cardinium sp.]